MKYSVGNVTPKYLIALGLVSIITLSGWASAQNISQQAVSSLVTRYSAAKKDNQYHSFTAFLTQLTTDKSIPEASDTLQAFNSAAILTKTQQNQIFRLLGIYSQLKYGNDAIETLRQLVAIPSFKTAGIPSHQSPAMQQLGKTLETIANDFGLHFENIDGRIFAITIPNNDKGSDIALHAHADVVPVNPSSWVLEDGTQLEPFELTTINGRMYGRGSEDDKNAIVAVIYAMRVIKEEELPLLNAFKLLIDTTEESGAEAIPYYLEHHPIPEYNLALDGSYPIVIAEKGYGTLMASFPVRAAAGSAVIDLMGALATNQIPAKSIATITSPTPSDLKAKLDTLAKTFIAENGNNFTVTSHISNQALKLIVKGVSAHSSDPGSGVNPVSRMLKFIDTAHRQKLISSNHITDAAQYAMDNFGLDYLGRRLGVSYSHEFMGPLTMALTFINIDEEIIRLAVNLRAPKGKTPALLQSEVKAKLDSWLKNSGIAMSFRHEQRNAMYRNPEGKWVNALLDIATENLGLMRKFGTSGGSTSIHNLPNGVQFGLSLASEKYTGHNANEFKRVEQFMTDLRIVTEMIARLGGMEEL